jgi:hypothetical protein
MQPVTKTEMDQIVPAADQRDSQLVELGASCLGYLAETPEELARFMDVAGYSPAALRRAVGTPALALGLVDYFAANESILLAFCANTGNRPEDVMRVWHAYNPS